MKVLVVGDGVKIYSNAFFEAFKHLNHETKSFVWSSYFKGSGIRSFFNKLQNKLLFGPIISSLNNDLLSLVKEFKPELIFIYRGQYIHPNTLSLLKQSGAILFSYHNDNPFKKKYNFFDIDRHYLNGLPYYDWIFSYRKENIIDYEKIGYQNSSLLRSYYLKNDNFFIEENYKNKFTCDVLFIGHWEDDGRDEMVLSLARLGINIKVFGTEWNKSKNYPELQKYFGNIVAIRGLNYNIALNSAKIALVFLSKLNRDTYTRRCFEITATKTFMLAEYTDDLNSLYQEGLEAEYFRSISELLLKVEIYLNDDRHRNKIAINGYKQLIESGHESVDRVKEILQQYKRLCNENK